MFSVLCALMALCSCVQQFLGNFTIAHKKESEKRSPGLQGSYVAQLVASLSDPDNWLPKELKSSLPLLE
jgi:hypothetical protein